MTLDTDILDGNGSPCCSDSHSVGPTVPESTEMFQVVTLGILNGISKVWSKLASVEHLMQRGRMCLAFLIPIIANQTTDSKEINLQHQALWN